MKFVNCVAATLLLAGPVVFGADAQDLPDDGSQPVPQGIEQSAEKLKQLVAPIALYSDSLIAQVLSGATYPEEIVDASKWIDQHSGLAGPDLANQVDQQPWTPQRWNVARIGIEMTLCRHPCPGSSQQSYVRYP